MSLAHWCACVCNELKKNSDSWSLYVLHRLKDFPWICSSRKHFHFHFFFKRLILYICLAVPGLCCSMQDLVSWPGIKPRSPALETQSLRHWTTREVPSVFNMGLPSVRILAFKAPPSLHCSFFLPHRYILDIVFHSTMGNNNCYFLGTYWKQGTLHTISWGLDTYPI